jgi:hypothetical protein
VAGSARYYDATTALFLTIDPALASTGQPYAYVNDNPLNLIDPLGLSWWNPGTWNPNVRIGVGLVLGIAAAATGVDALVEIVGAAAIWLGSASFVFGTGAVSLDYGPCFNNHEAAACAGFWLGAGGAVAGAAGAVGDALVGTGVIAPDSTSSAALGGHGGFGFSIGLGGTAVDLGSDIAPGKRPCAGGGR